MNVWFSAFLIRLHRCAKSKRIKCHSMDLVDGGSSRDVTHEMGVHCFVGGGRLIATAQQLPEQRRKFGKYTIRISTNHQANTWRLWRASDSRYPRFLLRWWFVMYTCPAAVGHVGQKTSCGITTGIFPRELRKFFSLWRISMNPVKNQKVKALP